MMTDAASSMPHPEEMLALGYAPAAARGALAALFALDRRLGSILRGTQEPMVGQMRLTWWHDALSRLDSGAPPAEPVLSDLAATVLPRGVAGSTLAAMIDGWEALLDDPLDAAALAAHARARGGRLFVAGGQVLGNAAPFLAVAGEGWALADLAGNMSDPTPAAQARAMAAEPLDSALAQPWPVAVRALGALAHGARMTLRQPGRAPGHPLRVARLLRHRLTGR